MESEGWDNMARLMNETEGSAYRDAYNTGANIFNQDENRMLQALGMGDQSRQFGSKINLEAQRLKDLSNQYGSGLDLKAQELTDSSLRFGSEEALKEQSLSDASNQFLSGQDLEAQALSESSRQYGANYGLDALGMALEGAMAQGDLSGQELDQALKILGTQLDAGGIERGIYQEGLDADKAQFEEERDYPFKVTQFLQSLIQGLPLEAVNNQYADPSWLTQFGGGAGLAEALMAILNGDNG